MFNWKEGVSQLDSKGWYKNWEIEFSFPSDLNEEAFELPERVIEDWDSVLYLSKAYDNDSQELLWAWPLEIVILQENLFDWVYQEIIWMKFLQGEIF